MDKYVKTDYVPDRVCYLTVGKEYEVLNEYGYGGYRIIHDEGRMIDLHIYSCAHLDGKPWTVIER